MNASEVAGRRAFEIAPLKSDALRNLGLIADARGRQASAALIMSRAGRRGFRDVPTQAWLLQQAILRRDYGSAFLRVDALLRTQPDLSDRLFPLIGALLNEPDAIDPFSRRLATNPPWRASALHYLGRNATDLVPIVAIYQALGRLGQSPTYNEVATLLERLIANGRYMTAYRLWMSFLPTYARTKMQEPYDGRFKGLPGAPPFNWDFSQTPEVTVEIARVGHSPETALYVQFPVATTTQLAQQLLVLPPGAYHLTGRLRVTGPAAGTTLVWTVRCEPAPTTLLAETRQSGDSVTNWIPFSINFTAPAGCDAQWLRLGGLAGDGFDTLSAWVKDISIQPLSAGTVTAATPRAGAQDQRGQTTP